ncbi:MAG: PD-(D/E)XK nuclease family protein [Solirubrobacterales bacterium]|nr:PD-(D/E)XK nuclease family protein [Solirubrobacterales bacterium]
MPLHLIHGPPNTGRTDLVEASFLDQLDREPFLVVPGIDDIFGWEKRLTRDDGPNGSGAIVGGRVMHFRDLCREVLVQAGEPPADNASELQRLHFIRKAIYREWGTVADRLDEQPGLAASVLELIDEFRAEMIDPTTLGDRVDRSGLTGLRSLVGVYSAYLDLLVDGAGLSDGPRDAERAVKTVSGSWGERPLFIAGFDDMTPQQLELIRRISVDAGAAVTVAVAHEPDNPALDWTNSLVASLKDDARATALTEQPTSRASTSGSHDPVLLELERRFMKPPGQEPRLPASDAVAVMRSSGARNEAEAIGAEIARLIKGDAGNDGVGPGEIAVAVGSPAVNGPLIRDVLARYSIPVALESETAARVTTVGQTILSVLSAVAPGAGPEPALAWLRGPLGPDPEMVDRVEFRALVDAFPSARQVIDAVESGPPDGWKELTDAIADRKTVNEVVAELSREAGARLLAMDEHLPPSPGTVIETQMASAIATAAEQLLEIQDTRSNGLADVRAAIETDAIRIWSVPAAGTVRITSPYSLRAKRFRHLFMAAQQEGGIRDLDRSGPFLSRSDRHGNDPAESDNGQSVARSPETNQGSNEPDSGLGMSERRDPEVQERYLFYSCITVPTEGLWISCQTSDEAGEAEQPSPLVGLVEELFEQTGEGVPVVRRGGRAGSEIVFGLGRAPSLDEAARSIAASGGNPADLLTNPGQSGPVGGRLDAARALEASTRTLGDIRLECILDELKRDPRFGATEIEAYAGCPYRWFVERQLRPTDFGPEPDYLAIGTLVHAVLEDLFKLLLSADQGTGESLGDLYSGTATDDWLSLVPALVEEHAGRVGLGGSDPAARGNRLRVTALVSTYLRREAARFREGSPPRHSVAKLELAFGTRRARREAIDMNGWGLVGKIDRVDLNRDGREAVAIDYKTGDVGGLGRETATKKGRIQLQLYLRALETMGYEPVAALYVPVRQDGGTSRGAYSADLEGEMLRRGASRADKVRDLSKFIEAGVDLARDAVDDMLAGTVEHDPASCRDHFRHAAVPNPGEGDEDR